jgi:hypothetical protein
MEKNKKSGTSAFPVVAAVLLSFVFVSVSLFFSQSAIGFNNGYGYDCSSKYGYGYFCDNKNNQDDKGHKGGLVWKKYKQYKQKYDKKKSRQVYFKLKYLKKSKNPSLNASFWEMRNIYLMHKFDSKEAFSLLNPEIQEKFNLYKKYHGHSKYREYKETVY